LQGEKKGPRFFTSDRWIKRGKTAALLTGRRKTEGGESTLWGRKRQADVTKGEISRYLNVRGSKKLGFFDVKGDYRPTLTQDVEERQWAELGEGFVSCLPRAARKREKRDLKEDLRTCRQKKKDNARILRRKKGQGTAGGPGYFPREGVAA